MQGWAVLLEPTFNQLSDFQYINRLASGSPGKVCHVPLQVTENLDLMLPLPVDFLCYPLRLETRTSGC